MPAPDQPLPDGLPPPDDVTRAHGERVAAHIAQAIDDAGGWIPFSGFMRRALYAPGLGYYAAGLRKFGEGGDFVTAPGISPLFGGAIANALAGVLNETGGSVLELGAGTGTLALDILKRLDALDALPVSYAILETSPDLRERQRETIATHAPGLLAGVQWLDTLPETWTGVILGNEVLDAVPAELVVRTSGALARRGVGLDEAGRFAWRDVTFEGADRLDGAESLPPAVGDLLPGPGSTPHEGDNPAPGPTALRDAAARRFPPGDYLSELNPEAEALTATLGRLLARGLLLWIDYGFPAHEYYHPQRSMGTLMCHYQHRAHADPLVLAGLQDITAHVDFTAIAEAGIGAGLQLEGYTAQAQFLVECGIADLLQTRGEPGTAAWARATSAMQLLLSPAEMGELFKVIALSRGIEGRVLGFGRGDRSGRLFTTPGR